MLRVLVADDHNLVRESIVKAVSVGGDVEVIAQAEDGPSALERCRELQPDLALLDVAMPGLDGLSVAAELRKDLPGLRIIMLTMHDDVGSVERALSIPVDGFVSKSAAIAELVAAIQTVRNGGRYLSDDLIDRGASDGQNSPAALTTRERQILQLLSEGQRPGEIAKTLFVSIKTVKNHLTSVYFKLGVETGAQAVAEAFQRGLVSRS
jgi:two-component system, NarL family, nitrate/nitrite response regulator NarL